jgi:predicted amidohydrolase YtcJ
MRLLAILSFISILFFSCGNTSQKQVVDSILYNATLISMDENIHDASVLVIKDKKIFAIGGTELLDSYTCPPEKKIDLNKAFVYPGLIDAHCHFYGYAKTSLSVNLVGSKSWEQVLQLVDSFSKNNENSWVTGRGWDQNDWKNKAYPDNSELNTRFPNQPVLLKRIDGHAAICNQKALDLAGIHADTKVSGGEIVLLNGQPSGVLVDNAVDLVQNLIPEPSAESLISALQSAEAECFQYGLTTLVDAGLDLNECLFLDSLQRKNQLSIFLYLMLNPTADAMNYANSTGIYESELCKISSFKLYADGALGSRGACLKKGYCDRKDHQGMMLFSAQFYDSFCNLANQTPYQVNTHCIGDSANRYFLEVYGKYLKTKNDRRWRIEHAQIIDTKDIHLFGKYSIIPSVQPTHASSDAPWVKDRLCSDRMGGAYAYKKLLQENGYLPLGTDFPVEYINPLYTFYSAVFRQNALQPEQEVFTPEECLSREEALKGMTIWAAKSCFLENRKGSLSVGKDADFVVMDKNLLTVDKADILKTKIRATYSRGKKVY